MNASHYESTGNISTEEQGAKNKFKTWTSFYNYMEKNRGLLKK